MAARLKERYQKEVRKKIQDEFGIKNVMAVPKVEKIVVNMGIGEAIANMKVLDNAAEELAQIAGQKPVVTKAKKSIASFKLRAGVPIGTMVTLRGEKMYEFLDRLINIALPRVRDFRGVPTKSFDGRLPKTEYRLTAAGRRALERYLNHMEALIRATREG